ncbi:ankyrin repeat domain-containing protein [Wolbachia endosymbiont (group A) of Bibio marci]|uniref:ankyrin repeat domain-containing protein n=1 Tax=Wolbachia endosymbiont (group A) of Bibio marci TaxID=2953987 RepID=UPI002230F56D|nr:ankyrin repeat domain-containing protein [Wolbachia endosymbiont (group A) of Bibio marci]
MLYGENRTNTNGYRYQRTLDEPTQKLFEAIDDENLEGFKQALAEGADVNAFDKEGMTPLVSIVTNLSAGFKKEYQNMIRLLLLHQRIDVNICEKSNDDTALHLAMCFQQKKTLQLLLSHPNINTNITNKKYQSPSEYARQNRAEHLVIEIQKAQRGRQLLDALFKEDISRAKTLLGQELNPNCWKRNQNGEIETPLRLICLQGITQDNEEVLTKLLKHKDLDFSQIKPIQAIEQNRWVKQIIEQAIKERLTDTINRKDLDDVKKLIEDNCFINRAIVTAALRDASEPTESVKNCLNEKFPASAEQPVASTHNVQPVINDEFIARELQQLENFRDELERKEAQLVEKEQELANKTSKISQLEENLIQVKREKSAQQSELIEFKRIVHGRADDTVEILQLRRDLKQVREERDRLSSENRLLRSNKNEKPSQAISPGRKQSNYASASFMLSGAFAVGTCLAVLYDYPVIGACLTAVALVLFLVGYYLCKADERDIGPGSATDNPQVTRVLTFSPNSAENSYTY